MNSGKDGQFNEEGRIEELFGRILETETINHESGAELLQDELSEDETERIMGFIMEKMGEERITMKTGEKKRRIMVIALIAVLAFATTAFAAELFQWDARISNYLGIQEKDKTELSESGMNVGVSAETNGVKIEAVQTIGDANNMYIVLDVTSPDGMVIHPDSRFSMVYLKIDGATGMGYSCDMLPDENDKDNKATLMVSLEANRTINHKTINLKFDDLGHFEPGNPDLITDYKGEWELEWQLNYQDLSKKYEIGRDLTVNGKNVRVDSAAVSSIALNVRISGDYIKEYDSVPPEPGAGDLIQITKVGLKDGSVLTQEDASGWGTSIDGDEYMINMKMKKLMDADQVKSITLNDTEFLLEE